MMNTARHPSFPLLAGMAALLCVPAVLWGCASSGKNADKTPVSREGGPAAAQPAFPAVSFAPETMPAGDLVRRIGEEVGGGLVLINGLEEHSVPAFSVNNAPYGELAGSVAEAVGCEALPLPHAWVILPYEYASLLETDLSGSLPPETAALTGTVAFGGKTPMYNVLSVLSQNLGVTLVADNQLSETRCGELFLGPAPLSGILEAVWISARVPREAYAVETVGSAVFFRSVRNATPPSLLLNADALTPEQRAVVDRVVDAVLPEPGDAPAETAFSARPKPLKDVLTPLSRQLGVVVSAKTVFAEVPVSPCVFKGARVAEVMDLMLRQWPTDKVGWEVSGEELLIRPR